MMETKLLIESVAEAPIKVGNRWKVIVARPGQGSSGKYSAEVLREFGPRALHPGSKSFINHGSDRNPKDMIGTYPDGGYWDFEENALAAELDVFSHWKDFVEEVGPHCGISIYMSGDLDEDGNVVSIHERRQNGADLVAEPGLIGSGIVEQLYESAKALDSEKEPGTGSVQDNQRKANENMDVEAKLAELTAAVSELVADSKAKRESAAPIEVTPAEVETAVQEALAEYISRETAIIEAKLSEASTTDLLAKAKEGVDVLPLIESAKTLEEGLEKSLREKILAESAPGGRVIDGANAPASTLSAFGGSR